MCAVAPSPSPRSPARTLAHTLDPRIQGDQLKNRLFLKDGLEEQGLVNYENEWWHFTFKPEPSPDTYFDFPVDPSSLGH